MTDPLAFLAAALDAAQRDAEYSRDEFMFFDTGDERAADHYQRAGSPAAVLRRIAADRKLIAEYEKARAEYDADGKTWDYESNVGRARTAALEEAVRIVAEGWGWTEETT